MSDARTRLNVLYVDLQEDLRRQGYEVSFLQKVDLPPIGASPSEAAAHSILRSFTKKFEESNRSADEAALRKFLQCNLACKSWALEVSNSKEEELWGEFRRSLYDFFNPKGYALLSNHLDPMILGRLGNGSNIKGTGTDFYSKLFSSTLSSTSLFLTNLYSRYISYHPIWLAGEKTRFDKYGRGDIVEGNRLSFVPKNREISRCICVEPVLNTYAQLGIAQILSDRLSRYFGIDFDRQPDVNRELAWRGSVVDDLVTIDLSSASDSMSLHMLEAVLDKETFRFLCKYRSPTCWLPSGRVELDIFSSMGNGFTFPLQTILFSCIVSAVHRWHGVERPHVSRGMLPFGVFGDDIICHRDMARDVLTLLRLSGFSVNTDKTFVEGPFRESCGEDFYQGVNIRGVYVKHLDDEHDYHVVANRIVEFSTRTNLFFPRTVRRLVNYVGPNYVPLRENEEAGFKVDWLTAVKSGVRSSVTRSGLRTYRALVPRVASLHVGDDCITVPKGDKGRIYNPHGLLISFLQGGLTNGKIGVRKDNPQYRWKRRITPWWDFALAKPNGSAEWQRLINAVRNTY